MLSALCGGPQGDGLLCAVPQGAGADLYPVYRAACALGARRTFPRGDRGEAQPRQRHADAALQKAGDGGTDRPPPQRAGRAQRAHHADRRGTDTERARGGDPPEGGKLPAALAGRGGHALRAAAQDSECIKTNGCRFSGGRFTSRHRAEISS